MNQEASHLKAELIPDTLSGVGSAFCLTPSDPLTGRSRPGTPLIGGVMARPFRLSPRESDAGTLISKSGKRTGEKRTYLRRAAPELAALRVRPIFEKGDQ